VDAVPPAPPSVERLLAALTERDALIAELREVNAGLVERVAELERRLGQSPRNSSRPPASEGYAKPPPRSQRRRSGRKPGGQPGAQASALRQVGVPDEVVVHRAQVCAGCGGGLAGAPVTSVERRQVLDLPPVALRTVEHRVEHRRCGCGTTTMAPVPAGVGAPVQYGPGVRAVGVYLVAAQHLPYQRAAATLSDLCGAAVSTGSLAGWVGDAATGVGPFLTAVRGRLAAAPVVHADETGLRTDGKLAWVHSASTSQLSLFTVHARRGVAAMDSAGVLPGLGSGQVLVHDGWKPYRHYDVDHGLCNAHHLRELAAAAEVPGQQWAAAMADLLRDAHRAVLAAKQDGRATLPPPVLAELARRYEQTIAVGKAANPEPGPGSRRRRRTPAANLLARLDSQRGDVLRFTTDFRVPFDNNQAERDIRMVKLRQKISGCLRTLTGAQNFAALRSYLSTAVKHGREPLDVLRQLIAGTPWLLDPAPS
jgi:transposase